MSFNVFHETVDDTEDCELCGASLEGSAIVIDAPILTLAICPYCEMQLRDAIDEERKAIKRPASPTENPPRDVLAPSVIEQRRRDALTRHNRGLPGLPIDQVCASHEALRARLTAVERERDEESASDNGRS